MRWWLLDPGRQGDSWQTGQFSIRVHISQKEQLWSETDCATQGSSVEKESLKNSGCENLWWLRQWEKLPASQESSLERPTGF